MTTQRSTDLHELDGLLTEIAYLATKFDRDLELALEDETDLSLVRALTVRNASGHPHDQVFERALVLATSLSQTRKVVP